MPVILSSALKPKSMAPESPIGDLPLLHPAVHCRRTVPLDCAVIPSHLGIGYGSARWPASAQGKKGEQQRRM
jgi:hypothetical protein